MNLKPFCVVRFIELPFEDIDAYVCVPKDWVIVCRQHDKKAIIVYPPHEDPLNTKERAKRNETHGKEWRSYIASVKYESDTYREAEYWIAMRNDYGPIVEEDSKEDTQPKFTSNRQLRSSNMKASSKAKKDKAKSRMNPRKPLPRTCALWNGLSAMSLSMQKLHKTRLKLHKMAGGPAVDYVLSGYSKREESPDDIRNGHLESAQSGETAAVSSDIKMERSTQQKFTEQNRWENQAGPSNVRPPSRLNCKQAPSLPMLNDNDTEMITVDDEGSVQVDERSSEAHGHGQSSSNATAASVTALKPPTTVVPTFQPNRHSGNSLQNFQPQMEEVRSLATTNNEQNSRIDDVSNNGQSTSYHSLESRKMVNNLYSQMNGARRLIPIHPPVLKEIRPMNIKRSTDIATQNPSHLMEPLGSVMRSVEQPSRTNEGVAINLNQYVPRTNIGRSHDDTVADSGAVANITSFPSSSHQGPSLALQLNEQRNSPAEEEYEQQMQINQDNFQQDQRRQEQLRRSTDSNNIVSQPNPNLIRDPSSLNVKLSLQRQPQSNLHDSQQQSQRPKVYVRITHRREKEIFCDITVNDKKRPESSSQGVDKRIASVVSKVLKSIEQSMSSTPDNYLQNEQQLQASLSRRSTDRNNTDLATVPENITASATHGLQSSKMPACSSHDNMHQSLRSQKLLMDLPAARSSRLVDSACQTNVSMIDNHPSPYNGIDPNYEAVTDREVMLDHEMSTHEAPVESRNDVDRAGTSNQNNSRVILEQKMLDHFATLFTQMGNTLRYTCDMYNNLRDSIHETAETYRGLLTAVERFNSRRISPDNASHSSNGTPEAPHVTEDGQRGVTAGENSSNGGECNSNVVKEAPKKKHNNLWRFVPPPEYDPHDTRWTLKYRKHLPGLLELVPGSKVYVSCGGLKYCQQKSKDCKSLARLLLEEIFSRKALSVCLSLTEEAIASNAVGSNVRPKLDERACEVLLAFVKERGQQRGWDTDERPILNHIHSTIQKMRFRYGMVVKC